MTVEIDEKIAEIIAKRIEQQHGTTVGYDAADIIKEEIGAVYSYGKTIALGKQDCAFIIRYDTEGKYGFEMAFPARDEQDFVPVMELAITAAFLRIVNDQDQQFIEDVVNHFSNKHADDIEKCKKELEGAVDES